MVFDLYQGLKPTLFQDESEFLGLNKMHSRRPMFHMPEWMSEDDGVPNLSSRISHGPNWGFGNRGNWGEMQNPGENETFNRNEAVGHTIPIKIEAEAPPGWVPQQSNVSASINKDEVEVKSPQCQESINPEMKIGNQPAFASKTTPTVDSCVQQEIARDERSSSAPPDVKDKEVESPRFITKMNIIPQQPQNDASQTFNNIAKPFHTSSCNQDLVTEKIPVDIVDSSKAAPAENSTNLSNHNKMPAHQQVPQQTAAQSQKTSVIRNIPIFFEDGDGSSNDNPNPVPSPPTRQHTQPRGPTWNQQFGNMPAGFPDEAFQDPFFGYNRFNSPKSQRREQPVPNDFSRDHNYTEQQRRDQPQTFHHQSTGARQPQEKFKEPQQQSQEKSQRDEGVDIIVNKDVQETQPKDVQMEKMTSVRNSLVEYKKTIDAFNSTEKNKEYRYLDEMLTRALLELDNIDPNGRDDIRQTRRTLIKDINSYITLLEKKLKPASVTVEPMETNESKDSSVKSEAINDEKKTKIETDNNEIPEVSLNEETNCSNTSSNDGDNSNQEKGTSVVA